MTEYAEIMRKVFERCDISFEGYTISKEMLMKAYINYLNQTICKESHNVGVVLYTGSICFDVMAVIYASILSIVENESSPSDIVESLAQGDLVIYDNGRYIFEAIEKGLSLHTGGGETRFAVLTQGRNGRKIVSESKWHKIIPYYGDSECLDGRGIRSNNSDIREAFFKEVLETKEYIPSIIDKSSVFIMQKDKAERLVKGIQVSFGDKRISLLELVSVSYFSEEEEYAYGGNSSRNEAVLKIASKVSVARQLILKRGGNKHLGFFVLGSDMINRSLSELPELIERKSLQYAIICTDVSSDFAVKIMEENEEATLFPCTKDFLLEYSLPPVIINQFTMGLSEQVDTVIEKDVAKQIIEQAPILLDDYKRFKNNILNLKRMEYGLEGLEQFIIQSQALMNLIKTAVFPLKQLDEAVSAGNIEIISTKERIIKLHEIIDPYPMDIKELCLQCIDILDGGLENSWENSEKGKWLIEYLRTNRNKKIAIVVPKAYYITLISEIIERWRFTNIHLMTVGQFDGTRQYDSIIVLGEYIGKKFNVFSCGASKVLISLLYPCEKQAYRMREIHEKKKIQFINTRATLGLDWIEEEIEEEENQDDYNLQETEKEIDEYLESFLSNPNAYFFGYQQPNGMSTNVSEVVALVTFEEGQSAFLSKRYKAYVLDEDSGKANEVIVDNIHEGDAIVFTQNNRETKDIVDSILDKLIADHKLDDGKVDAYEKSKTWRSDLINFMNKNNYSIREISNILNRYGTSVVDATIRTWLDEDAHMVGPMDKSSIISIAKAVGNDDMLINADLYFNACRQIRSLRRDILGIIGEAIIDRVCNKVPQAGTLYADIYDRIEGLALVLHIDRIMKIDRTMPMYIVNRPIVDEGR